MMKISIITLQNISNYGSVLQAYATQEYFLGLGYEAELVDYWRTNMVDKNIAQDIVEHKNLKLKQIWGKSIILRKLMTHLLSKKIENRAKVFRQFTSKYLSTTSRRYVSIDDLRRSPPEGDIYCVGSDQVWNSDWNGGFDEAFYLQYGNKDIARIAFSSSFGVETLPEEEAKRVSEILSEYSIITVREASAKDLINKLGIKGVEHILDPTLLLGKEEWGKIANAELSKLGPYILVYQLNENEMFDKAVQIAAEKFNCKVVRIEYRKTEKAGEHFVLPRVEDWVSLFYYAQYVITDSFHATAFSINFNKKFINILPNKFGTRIISLLQLVGQEDRIIKELSQVEALNVSIEYCSINKVLERERDRIRDIFKPIDELSRN